MTEKEEPIEAIVARKMEELPEIKEGLKLAQEKSLDAIEWLETFGFPAMAEYLDVTNSYIDVFTRSGGFLDVLEAGRDDSAEKFEADASLEKEAPK